MKKKEEEEGETPLPSWPHYLLSSNPKTHPLSLQLICCGLSPSLPSLHPPPLAHPPRRTTRTALLGRGLRTMPLALVGAAAVAAVVTAAVAGGRRRAYGIIRLSVTFRWICSKHWWRAGRRTRRRGEGREGLGGTRAGILLLPNGTGMALKTEVEKRLKRRSGRGACLKMMKEGRALSANSLILTPGSVTIPSK